MIYNDLEKIINRYGVRNQIKKFAKESYELEEAVIDAIDSRSVERFDHVAEELADVMVLWEQIRLYYGIPTQTIKGIVTEKVNRQLKKMKDEKRRTRKIQKFVHALH